MMASDKKTKADAAAKSEKSAPAAPDKGTSGAASAKAESSAPSTDAAPANYSRGEGQKPVSQAYRDNWNAIFATKTRPKNKKATPARKKR
jgi:hypothetical protein